MLHESEIDKKVNMGYLAAYNAMLLIGSAIFGKINQ